MLFRPTREAGLVEGERDSLHETGGVLFSSSSSVIHDTKTGTGEPVLTSQSASSAEDEYEEQVTICHRTSATDRGNTLKLSPSGAANHLKNHRYDYAGPCHS